MDHARPVADVGGTVGERVEGSRDGVGVDRAPGRTRVDLVAGEQVDLCLLYTSPSPRD